MADTGGVAPGAERPGAWPLLDRDAELAELLRAVEAGAGVVLVEGGPGVGKSRLLAEARAMASAAGVRVLTARASEIERDYPYGVARQLFEAAVFGPEGERWLAGKAASAAPVFRPSAEAAPYAVLNGLYWLTVNAAEQGRLLLAIDDLHWADEPSVAFVDFLLRRLEGLPVSLVLGSRPAAVADQIASDPNTLVLTPRPLQPAATAALAGRVLGTPPSERFAAACHRATGGNPLFLGELLRALRTEGIAPDDRSLGAIEQVGPAAVSLVVLVRLHGVSREAVAVAQALAVLDRGARTPVLAALADLHEEHVQRALDELVQAEVVDRGLRPTLVHPIVRDAIYHDISHAERDRRHLRAAQILETPEETGAHLLATPAQGRPWVVDALRSAARDALGRGAITSAVTFLRRALAERPGAAPPDLLLELGGAEAAVDAPASALHLERARAATPEPAARARIAELMTRMLVFTDPAGARAVARSARAEAPPELAEVELALAAMERYVERLEPGATPWPARDVEGASTGERMWLAVQAWDAALSGADAETCAALARRALPTGSGDLLTENPLFTTILATTVLGLADDPSAAGVWETLMRDASLSGVVHLLIAAGIWRGWLWRRVGELEAAEASLRQALGGTPLWGSGTGPVPAHADALLAQVLIERGDLPAARAVLYGRLAGGERPVGEGMLLHRVAELALLVAEGRDAEALAVVDGVADQLTGIENPAWAPWRSLQAQALGRLGRQEEAVAAVEEELRWARRWGTPGPIGRALVVAGTLQDREACFEEAVAVTRDTPARLEHAEALLALGGSLRRRGRLVDARTYLEPAIELATRSGAPSLARRATGELGAAGGRPASVPGSVAGELTPSERRVATLAAGGRRNREIAQELFVSPKTVEVHLSNAYRKLGIRTRDELSSALDSKVR